MEKFLLIENLPTICNDQSSGEGKRSSCLLEYSRKSPLEPKTKPTLMQCFLDAKGKEHTPSCETEITIPVANLTCKLQEREEIFLLHDASFEAPGKSLVVVTGPVGGGKSTVLSSIVGEVNITGGFIEYSGTAAYVSQAAWILSGTLQGNILFGERYDENKMSKVIEACTLTEDISRFSKGLLTFAGERGVVLSGGQQTSVSLARALYADADIYI